MKHLLASPNIGAGTAYMLGILLNICNVSSKSMLSSALIHSWFAVFEDNGDEER